MKVESTISGEKCATLFRAAIHLKIIQYNRTKDFSWEEGNKELRWLALHNDRYWSTNQDYQIPRTDALAKSSTKLMQRKFPFLYLTKKKELWINLISYALIYFFKKKQNKIGKRRSWNLMSINGSLVADMKGIKEIKRKRLNYWERIPEQNIRDTNLKKKNEKGSKSKSSRSKRLSGKKKHKNQQAVLLGQRSIWHTKKPPIGEEMFGCILTSSDGDIKHWQENRKLSARCRKTWSQKQKENRSKENGIKLFHYSNSNAHKIQ